MEDIMAALSYVARRSDDVEVALVSA